MAFQKSEELAVKRDAHPRLKRRTGGEQGPEAIPEVEDVYFPEGLGQDQVSPLLLGLDITRMHRGNGAPKLALHGVGAASALRDVAD
jgi:hypothetical protein